MSSAKLTRISTYNLLGDDKVVKLKKWSQAKFYTLIKVIGEILETISIPKEDGEISLNLQNIGKILVAASETAQAKLTFIIKESLDDKDITDEEILEWVPEDYFGVLNEIVTLNITEQFRKNLLSLRNAFQATKK